MNYNIKKLTEKYYKPVYEFQCEYLDKEEYTSFLRKVKEYPDLYLIALSDDDLAGICYGEPSEKTQSTVNLQGIAVNLDKSKDYARRGIGSALLCIFEKIAKSKGFSSVGVGAADDIKVESFYLKNEYIPYELVAKDESGYEYARIIIDNYTSGKAKQQSLKDEYNAWEVIFIFEKKLK